VAEPYVVIKLPWPVDAQGRTRATGKGRPKFSTHGGFVRAYTPAKTRAFENQIKIHAIAAMAAAGLEPLNEALGVEVLALIPIPMSWSSTKRARAHVGDIAPTSKPDCENIAKLIDGANHHPPQFKGDKIKRPIIWQDDSNIVTLSVRKSYSIRPMLTITVYRWFA